MPRFSPKVAAVPAVTPAAAPAVEFKDLTRQIQRAQGFPEALAALKNGRAATIDGAWGSAAGLVSAALGFHAPTSLVVVMAHMGDVDDFRDDMAVFAGITPEILPAWEKLPREQDPTDEVFGKRLRVISRMAGAMPPRLVVTSIQALLQPVPRREVLVQMSRRICVGDNLPVEELAAWLLDRGMQRAEVVEVPGEFSLRGGIFDVFPTDATEPVRIEFFGDEVESIRPFDAETQRSRDRWDNVTVTIPPTYDEQNRASFGPPTDYFPSGTWVALDRAHRSARGRAELPGPDRRPARLVFGGKHLRAADSVPLDRDLGPGRRIARGHMPSADRECRAVLGRPRPGQGRAR